MLKYKGTKWKFKDEITMPPNDINISISDQPTLIITSNGKHSGTIEAGASAGKIYFGSITAYKDGAWVDDAYRTIQFVEEPDRYSSTAISWFESNADQVIGHYIVSETDLRSISDAIRAKTGNDVLLSFPDDFVSAIQGL